VNSSAGENYMRNFGDAPRVAVSHAAGHVLKVLAGNAAAKCF
jgi:hypothetical protein